MSDMRVQFIKQLQASLGLRFKYGGIVDKLIALIPKPTVRVKCDKCGGKGEILSDKFACGCTISSNNYQSACGIHTLCYERERVPCPSCTDGCNEICECCGRKYE